jgi:hypothetical protein
MTELLRECLRECDSLRGVERQTGVSHVTLLKFRRGDQTIRLDKAEVLADYFGIEVSRPRKTSTKE